jgi:hypothetical protein
VAEHVLVVKVRRLRDLCPLHTQKNKYLPKTNRMKRKIA